MLGAVFLWSGFLKVHSPLAFADSIATFQILPVPLINLMALGLPPLELLLGCLLVAGIRRREAAFGIVMLTTVFLFSLGQALVRGLEVDCGCFGGGSPSSWKTWGAVGRDVLFLGVGAVLYHRGFRLLPESASVPRSLGR
jgi:hypothetical protein